MPVVAGVGIDEGWRWYWGSVRETREENSVGETREEKDGWERESGWGGRIRESECREGRRCVSDTCSCIRHMLAQQQLDREAPRVEASGSIV